MGRLDNKVALVTGGARGMGATQAKVLSMEGAKVVFGDILDEEGRKVEEEVRGIGGDVTYLHLDVTSEKDWRSAIDLAETKYGRLNVLVNNAGIIIRKNIDETTEEVWDQVMDVNAKGVFWGVKLAIPAMRRAGGGSIINISSISGLIGRGTPAYNASKGAVRVMSKVIAIDHAKENIRCNSLHPGNVETPMSLSGSGTHADRVAQVPLGRTGTTEDVAYGVVYLASDESAYVTGIELVIDGGMTAI